MDWVGGRAVVPLGKMAVVFFRVSGQTHFGPLAELDFYGRNLSDFLQLL
jgi:hypothetical protein